MLVRFKRNWFGPNGVHYKTRDGLAEVPDEFKDKLPSDAEIVNQDLILPSKGMEPIAGFGAIPEHEQKLADVGAAPTKQITRGAGEGQEPSKGDALDEDAPTNKPKGGDTPAKSDTKLKL